LYPIFSERYFGIADYIIKRFSTLADHNLEGTTMAKANKLWTWAKTFPIKEQLKYWVPDLLRMHPHIKPHLNTHVPQARVRSSKAFKERRGLITKTAAKKKADKDMYEKKKKAVIKIAHFPEILYHILTSTHALYPTRKLLVNSLGAEPDMQKWIKCSFLQTKQILMTASHA
jgi:hypothetical protein